MELAKKLDSCISIRNTEFQSICRKQAKLEYENSNDLSKEITAYTDSINELKTSITNSHMIENEKLAKLLGSMFSSIEEERMYFEKNGIDSDVNYINDLNSERGKTLAQVRGLFKKALENIYA